MERDQRNELTPVSGYGDPAFYSGEKGGQLHRVDAVRGGDYCEALRASSLPISAPAISARPEDRFASPHWPQGSRVAWPAMIGEPDQRYACGKSFSTHASVIFLRVAGSAGRLKGMTM